MIDVVVAGGGAAGAAAAMVLARTGVRVVLCDAADGHPAKVGEALPPAAAPVLRDLSLAGTLDADHLRSYGNVAAWGAEEPYTVDFLRDPNGHGWHVDRGRFEAALRAAAQDAGARVRTGCSTRLLAGPRPWVISCAGDVLHARAFLDATGRRAALARVLGVRPERLDRLVATYADLAAPSDDVDARTFIYSCETGWWYTALAPGRRRVVAFLTDADLMPRTLRTPDGFTAALSAISLPGTGPHRLAGAPRTTAAHGALLPTVAGPGWAAAGDAALACDPLSSQGLLTALVTGMHAGRGIAAWLDGDTDALPEYAESVQAIAAAYQRNRQRTYSLERRWPDSPFWARRTRA